MIYIIFIQFGSDYCDIDGALFGLQGPLLYPTNQKDVLLFMGLEIGSKYVRVDVLKLNQSMQSVQYVGYFFCGEQRKPQNLHFFIRFTRLSIGR